LLAQVLHSFLQRLLCCLAQVLHSFLEGLPCLPRCYIAFFRGFLVSPGTTQLSSGCIVSPGATQLSSGLAFQVLHSFLQGLHCKLWRYTAFFRGCLVSPGATQHSSGCLISLGATQLSSELALLAQVLHSCLRTCIVCSGA
jgi:hypothetical protein